MNILRETWSFELLRCLASDRKSGAVLPIMAYTGRLRSKGVPFSGFRSWKSRDFTHLALWKGPKGRTDEFYGFIKTESVLFLWFIPIYMTMHLQQLKGIQSSKRGMWKGYHLSIEGIPKGYERGTLQKMVCKRVRGWTSGRSLSVQEFVEYPFGPKVYSKISLHHVFTGIDLERRNLLYKFRGF